MSYVTGVMLCTTVGESSTYIGEVNQWLKHNGFSDLTEVSPMCCNGKHPQMNMLGGGYNYFKHKEFAKYIMELPWQYPENVVLVLQVEEETKVYRPISQKECDCALRSFWEGPCRYHLTKDYGIVESI